MDSELSGSTKDESFNDGEINYRETINDLYTQWDFIKKNYTLYDGDFITLEKELEELIQYIKEIPDYYIHWERILQKVATYERRSWLRHRQESAYWIGLGLPQTEANDMSCLVKHTFGLHMEIIMEIRRAKDKYDIQNLEKVKAFKMKYGDYIPDIDDFIKNTPTMDARDFGYYFKKYNLISRFDKLEYSKDIVLLVGKGKRGISKENIRKYC